MTFASRAHVRRMGFPALCGPVADAPGPQHFLCMACYKGGTGDPLELLVQAPWDVVHTNKMALLWSLLGSGN